MHLHKKIYTGNIIMSSDSSTYYKEWYQNNKDRLKTKKNERFVCTICGGHYTEVNRATHNKSKKHIQICQLLDAKKQLEEQVHNLKCQNISCN